jgi:hypothetical protein
MIPDYRWKVTEPLFVAIKSAKIATALLHAPETGLSVNFELDSAPRVPCRLWD